jgi:hypothetical protein
MNLQFHYLKLLAICIFVVSCSRTDISFDDPSVLRGAWVAILGEGTTEKTIPLTFNATQNCSNNGSGQACDAYTITGQAMINGKPYEIKGSGTLGLSSPPAVRYGPYASAYIFEDKTNVAQIVSSQDSYSYEILFFTTNNPELSQIPKKGYLKKVVQ